MNTVETMQARTERETETDREANRETDRDRQTDIRRKAMLRLRKLYLSPPFQNLEACKQN